MTWEDVKPEGMHYSGRACKLSGLIILSSVGSSNNESGGGRGGAEAMCVCSCM